MESFKTAFLATTFTTEAAHRRLGLLQRVLEIVLYADVAPQEPCEATYADTLRALVTPGDAAVVYEWGTQWVREVTVENFQSTMTTLRAWVDALPRCTVYVPVQFDDTAAAVVGQWYRTEVMDNCLLALEVDPLVIGGCALIVDGHYVNYSFAERLKQTPTLIADILQTYATA